ncbi:MAG: coproporphyrinogen III oxidase [Candidatus Planktophila sp.]|jgi:putative oxygen-independent coproporphyrinogen III oxidase|nr:coproporphyrinogen III oxidase [Candidatus Planktophila sp.]
MSLSFYVHIPYCIKRCGYCDFNTYTPSELQDGATLEIVSNDYIDAVLKELEIAPREITPTIFFGGGTPSLLPAKDLGRVIEEIKNRNGLTSDCEITLEANPDSVTLEKLESYIKVGFNRISFGMQSAKPHVLQVLDRTHNPANVEKAVSMARAVGFESISVDLIYGTPGESLEDWRHTVEAALALDIDHISAYALIVETGTKLAANIKRGDIAMPNDDLMAEMYLLVDQLCQAKGMDWYELSNWSKPGHECKHNIAYWRNQNWWGLGPGAHSHVDAKRFWNVKHPTAYKQKVFAGQSVVAESEDLTIDQKRDEAIMLGIRMREGLSTMDLSSTQIQTLTTYGENGFVQLLEDRVLLTPTGRLIADRIVRELTF